MNSLQNKARIFKYCKIAFAAILGALVISSILAFTLGFEADLRYFNDSPIVIPFAIIAIVTLALAISSLFLFKNCSLEEYPEPLIRFVAMLPMIAVIRLVFHFAWSEYSRISETVKAGGELVLDAWTSILIVGAIFSAIYCLSEIFKVNKILKLVSGLMQLIFCIIAIAKLYIDFSVELNSPIKLLLQFSAAAMILCTLSDLRRELDIQNAAMFSLSRICSASLGLITAVVLFAEILPGADKYQDDYPVFALVFIAYGIKSAVEFFTSVVRGTKDFMSEEVTEAQNKENTSKAESQTENE